MLCQDDPDPHLVCHNKSAITHKMTATENGMSVSPIFCSVSDSGEQLNGFRVVVELRVETQIALHKISGCHVPLSILFLYTGILRENRGTIICDVILLICDHLRYKCQKSSDSNVRLRVSEHCIPNITGGMTHSRSPSKNFICNPLHLWLSHIMYCIL